MGRPLTEIDWDELDKLCGISCTLEEIAGWFKCSVDTIERAVERVHGMRFADYYEQMSAQGRISLRRKQFQLAQSGDKTMLIWLGKQLLGQEEKSRLDIGRIPQEQFDAEVERRLNERTKPRLVPGIPEDDTEGTTD